jgi:hypothetical protein
VKLLWPPRLLILLLPPFVGCAYDPAPSLFHEKREARNLTCKRLSQEEAHRQHPSVIPDLPARRFLTDSDALVCEQRFLPLGERPARDEAVLSSLRREASEIAHVVKAFTEERLTWHVDAFYPDALVASKISTAVKTELLSRGQAVSEVVPVLAAGDLAVLGRLPASQAYALACRRYFAEGALADTDAFLGVMIVDARETQLHAGVCVRSLWRWLR